MKYDERERPAMTSRRSAMKMAKRDLPTLPDDPHMLELEFPEAPEEHRFLRLGTDTSMMKDPVPSEIRTAITITGSGNELSFFTVAPSGPGPERNGTGSAAL